MRKWFSIISTLTLLLIALVISGVWQFNRVLSSLQIEKFSYELQTLNLHEIKFSHLSFVYETEKKQEVIALQNVHIDWQWPRWFSPELNTITIEHAQLNELAKENASPQDTSQTPLTLPATWSVPASLPKQIHIQQFLLKLHCPATKCSFAGNAKLLKIKTGLVVTGMSLDLQASPGDALHPQHQLKVNALYSVNQNLPKLDATFTVDQSVNLQFTTHLQKINETYWFGSLEGSAAYPDAWWLDYLSQWNIKLAQQPSAQATAATDPEKINTPTLSLKNSWQLALAPLIKVPSAASTAEWKKALTGNLLSDTKITQPITIVDLGEFSGQASIALDMTAGQLNHYELAAEVNANHLVIPENLQTLGVQADTVHIKINSKVKEAANLAALPVTFSGSSRGALQTQLAGNLLVDIFAKKITLEQLELTAKAKQLKPVAGLQLDNASLDLQATGEWQANGATIWPQLKFNGDASLKVGKLTHAQVHPKAWQWQGKAQGSLEDFAATGELGIGTSFNIKHQVKRKSAALHLDWQAPSIFLLAANPAVDIVKAWPPLLTLARGKINASGTALFDVEKNTLTKSNTNLQLLDITGIYDIIAFQGLNSELNINTLEQTLQIATDELSLVQVDKGFVIGPLSAAGNYQASWAKPAQGKLALQYLKGNAMDGTFSAAAQNFDFSRDTQQFTMDLNNINLATLLLNYPSSELSGNGQLSGKVPVEINAKGIRIVKGMVSANAPGGQLKYQSPRALAIAKTQPSMKIITEALNDFHYTVLASEVNYDEKGKLLLSVRLEGQNPALENGRPVHFNVNLEEDVPAMLASIQLSSKVTDIVKKRLQERLQKKNSPEATP
ncbi:MAG: YdbH domain-containing protein [Pseudomonadota bacterium]